MNKEHIKTQQNILKNRIIVFDWDNTLLPSHWLSKLGYKLDSDMTLVSKDLLTKLKSFSDSVNNILIQAMQFGKVVIITNAEKGWGESSAQKFLPDIFSIINKYNITIISARSNFEYLYPHNRQKWKKCAFEYILKFNDITYNEVISIGDSHFEREAVKSITAEMVNILYKSIKFIEKSTCYQLECQNKSMYDYLNNIINHDVSLDLCLNVNIHDKQQHYDCEYNHKLYYKKINEW